MAVPDIAAPSANQIQDELAASFTRGTDTTITLDDGALFPNPTPLGHVVYIHNADESRWCLVVYDDKDDADTLSMDAAADYALAKNVTVGDEAYEFPIGCVVELVCAADEIAQIFSTMVTKVGTPANDQFGVFTGDGTLEGTNDAKINSDGVVTFAAQSKARAYMNNGAAVQIVPDQTTVAILLDTEDYDEQNEFDSTSKSGAADATEANKLHDADGGFALGDVGATIWNTTDNTYTTVAAFVDAGELTLDDDIMVDTDAYILYRARFTVTVDGDYLILGGITYWPTIAADKRFYTYLRVNGTIVTRANLHTSHIGALTSQAADEFPLTIGDYVDLATWHPAGLNQDVFYGQAYTRLSVTKTG